MRLRRRRDIWDLVVIGGGVAGLTAAWHGVRCGLATALFEGAAVHGGQVANVNHLDDWVSTGETSGAALATALVTQLRDEAVELHGDPVCRIGLDGKLLRVEGASASVRARRVLIASGARLKPLGVPGEQQLTGKGVSQCADCDGYFFRGQDVVVVGAGDAALQEALVLAAACRSVAIVVRSAVRAKAAYVERAAGAANVRFVWDTTVEAILGKEAVTGVTFRNTKTGETTELACSGVFPFVGSSPDVDFLPPQVLRDESGRVVTDARMQTAVPSIYAAGAVRSGYSGALVAAAGEAATAVRAIAADLAL
jgi:thioredoxin reductase (NADPH)